MNAYRAILAAKGWEIRGALRSLRSESRLKTLVLATAMAGLFASMLWFAGLGLHYLRAESYYSSLRVYVHQVAFQVFFFSLGVMLLLSALLTSHAMLFRSRVTPFLLSHPVPPQVVTAARLAEAGAISTWAFLYLSFPLLLAYAIEEGGGLPLVALGGASLFLFAAVPVGIAGVLALALGLGTGRTRLAFWGVVLACTLALGAAIGPMATWRTWLSGVEREAVFQLLDRFSMTQHPLMPSTWLSHAWMRASHGDLGIAAFYVATLASWGIFALALAVSFGGRVLLSARSRVVSGRTARGTPVRDLLVRMSRPVMRVLGGPHAPLLEKDFRVFLRDPAQWAQFLIFVGLLAIYFVNIRRIGGLREEAGWRTLVATLNFAATSLTLCTFTSRFVFPMISLEGRRFWVLGLMPLSRTGILRSKFVLSSAAAVLVSGSLICLSDRMLDVPGWMMALHAGMVILVGLGLSGLSVGLGAMFPDFRTDNPSRIVSSFGGTLNLLLGLAYLLGVTALMALPVCLREVPRLFGSYGLSDLTFGAGLACASAASLLLTGLATWVPLRLGEKALERAEL